jgi:DNA-binding transcriptional MocR family regulator
MYAAVERGTLVPPSRQIANVLRRRIISGEYAPGSALPAITALAGEFERGADAGKASLSTALASFTICRTVVQSAY